MARLILKLSLSEQGNIEAEIVESPAGNALRPSNSTQAEKPSGVTYKDLQSHKNTLLKALEMGIFNSVFSPEELSWLVGAGLLDSEKTQFLSLQEKVGHILYQALFHSNEEVKNKLHDNRIICSSNGQRLHIQLMVNGGDDQLVRLFDYPWELLHDGENFLTQRNVVFSRYIAYGEPPPELHKAEKLRVLLVSLNAYDLSMELPEIPSREFDEICERLKAEEAIHLTTIVPSSFSEFGDYLTRLKSHEMPHVIHFHGHGLFGKHCRDCEQMHARVGQKSCARCGGSNLAGPQGYLLFKGKPWGYYASAKRLSDELSTANLKEDGKRQDRIALVVLSACQSGLALSNPSIFNGMAQSLIDVGIPAVVGMQFTVTISAAAEFATRFYSSLGRNAFLFEAMANGLVAMNFEGDQWYRPVLYTRWRGNEDGVLFKPASPQTIPPVGNPPLGFGASSGNFSERIKALHAQIQEKSNLLTKASAVFAREGIWGDNSNRELEHLQYFSVSVRAFSSCIDGADIGKLTREENQLRNRLKKPAHECKTTLEELISQVNGLVSLLKNRTGGELEDFDARKSRYLNTIRGIFTTLNQNLDWLRNVIETR